MLKQLAQHTVIYAAGNIGIRAASFLLIPLFTRALSQAEFGLLATLLMINQVLLVFMNVGMRDAFVRFFKQSKDDGELAALLGSCLLLSLGIGGLATTGILQFLQPLFRSLLHTDVVGRYLLLTCLFTLAQCLCTQLMSFYRSDGRPFAFLVAGIGCAFLLLVLNVLFLTKLNWGINGALCAYLLTYGAALLALAIHIIPQTGFAVSKTAVRNVVQFGFPLVLSQISDISIVALPTFFLSHYHGLRVVAVFAVGQKLAQLLVPFLVLPFQMALEPMIFNNLEHEELHEKLSNMLTYFVLVFVAITLLFMASSRALLFLAAPKRYDGSALVLAALLPTVLWLGLANFGRVLLHIRLRTDITGGFGVLFALVSLGLYHTLIGRHATEGALVAANVVRLLQGTVMIFFGLRVFQIPVDVKRLSIIGVGLLMVLAAFIASPWLSTIPFYTATGVWAAAGFAVLRWTNFLTEKEQAFIDHLLERCKCMFRR